jgi:hypothetical protein
MSESRIRKALVMVMRRRDLPPVEFRRRFAESGTARASRRDGVRSRCATLIAGEGAPVVPHQVLMSASPPPFDGVIEVEVEDRTANLGVAAAAAMRAIEPIVDIEASSGIVCDEVRITQGDGPIFVVMVLTRLPNLSHDAFMASWFGRHAAIGEAVEGVRYRQLHVVADETNALSARLGFAVPRIDGIATSYFLTVTEAVKLLSSDAVAVGAIADEKTFIDHSFSRFGLYETV